MEKFATIVVICILLGFMWLLLKPSLRPKSKQEKQQEIIASYKLYLDQKLTPHKDDREKLMEEKTKVLKRFSKELRHNLFFDEDEARALIRELASFEPS